MWVRVPFEVHRKLYKVDVRSNVTPWLLSVYVLKRILEQCKISPSSRRILDEYQQLVGSVGVGYKAVRPSVQFESDIPSK